MVQFRALVTPCMPTCEPVQCDQEDVSGELRSVHSFGRRRRRRRSTEPREDLLLVQSIQITDKFGFNKHGQQQRHQQAEGNATSYAGGEAVYVHQTEEDSFENFCVNIFGIVISCLIFLAVQIAVIIAWTYVWQRNKTTLKESHQYINDGKCPLPPTSGWLEPQLL